MLGSDEVSTVLGVERQGGGLEGGREQGGERRSNKLEIKEGSERKLTMVYMLRGRRNSA